MAKKENCLEEEVIRICSGAPRGLLLDIGCGDGHFSKRLQAMGFHVTAADMDQNRFQYHGKIPFKKCNLNDPLPFENGSFDAVLFLETIEHLRRPFSVISEISRVLKKDGLLILSTPNILNIGSRLRFLFEGSFDFFREPTLEYLLQNQDNLGNMHIVVWRYQELEYMLYENGLEVDSCHTDMIKPNLKTLSFFLLPLIRLQCALRRLRAHKKGGVDYARMDKVLLSRELLLGRHLILKTKKKRDADKTDLTDSLASHHTSF